MGYIVIIILSVILAGFFIWVWADYKEQKRKTDKAKEKPTFRTEDVLEEYGKPMRDEKYNPVDFDDTQ